MQNSELIEFVDTLMQIKQQISTEVCSVMIKSSDTEARSTCRIHQFGAKRVYLYTFNSNQLDPFASELTN